MQDHQSPLHPPQGNSGKGGLVLQTDLLACQPATGAGWPSVIAVFLLLGGTLASTRCTSISQQADSQSTSSNQSHSTSSLLVISTETLQLSINTIDLVSQRAVEQTSLLLQTSIQILNLLVNRSNKLRQTRNVHLGRQTNRNQDQQRDTNTQTGVDATLRQVGRTSPIRGTIRRTRLGVASDDTRSLVAVLILGNNLVASLQLLVNNDLPLTVIANLDSLLGLLTVLVSDSNGDIGTRLSGTSNLLVTVLSRINGRLDDLRSLRRIVLTRLIRVNRPGRATRNNRLLRLLNLDDYAVDLVAVLVLDNDNNLVARLSVLIDVDNQVAVLIDFDLTRALGLNRGAIRNVTAGVRDLDLVARLALVILPIRVISRSIRLLNLDDYAVDLLAVLVLDNDSDLVTRLSVCLLYTSDAADDCCRV